MQIGKPLRKITVEPVRHPVPRRERERDAPHGPATPSAPIREPAPTPAQ